MDKEALIKYLRHIGDSYVEEEPDLDCSPECRGREFCPKYNDCGICRFEYMKKQGWLNIV